MNKLAKLEIPSKITIGGVEHEVLVVDDTNPELNHPTDREYCYGRINHMKGKIYLNEKVDGDSRLQTFLHEVVHGIDESHCIKDEDRLKESEVQRIATGFLEVLKSWSKEK